ncbi:MAG TPA: hypothetical protein VLH56_04465 [Dissulfurispiraceae bacterium]|nr:hypothetical protein [Dissulfurispiraceae bacterium]
MRAVLIIVSILFFASSAFATAQFSELLEYRGETEKMFSVPLENYFSPENPKPEPFTKNLCTACRRGYVGKWKIEDGYLCLVSLHQCCTQEPKAFPLEAINPEWKSPVRATWYTGTLRIVQGRLMKYTHMEFKSKYERDLFIQIEGGKVMSEKVVDNTATKGNQNGQ